MFLFQRPLHQEHYWFFRMEIMNFDETSLKPGDLVVKKLFSKNIFNIGLVLKILPEKTHLCKQKVKQNFITKYIRHLVFV